MNPTLQRISVCFAAGCVGGLVNALLVWYLGSKGLPQKLGVSIAPTLTAAFVYARMVWGGIWGQVFLLPLWRGGFWVGVFGRGILFSILPTLAQLFYVFPVIQGKGTMGLALGQLTPAFVCLYNAAWGLAAALWLRWAGGEK
jgi:hypothetical protein